MEFGSASSIGNIKIEIVTLAVKGSVKLTTDPLIDMTKSTKEEVLLSDLI